MKFVYEEAEPFNLYFHVQRDHEDAFARKNNFVDVKNFLMKLMKGELTGIPPAFYAVDEREIHICLRNERDVEDYIAIMDHELYHHIISTIDSTFNTFIFDRISPLFDEKEQEYYDKYGLGDLT